MYLLSSWVTVIWKKDGETKREMILTTQPTSEATVVEHSLSGGCFALGLLSTYGRWLRKYTFFTYGIDMGYYTNVAGLVGGNSSSCGSKICPALDRGRKGPQMS